MYKTPEELLPHDHPMIVISEVENVDLKSGNLTARADIKKTDILYQPHINGVPTYSALEYMAQTIGCFAGYYDLEINPNKKPAVGFLLGTKKMEVFTPVLNVDESYFIKVQELFMEENLASFECSMYNKENKIVANAIINTYRPENVDDFLKEL